jgi:ParB-like chromosome segregation protein Spo0J
MVVVVGHTRLMAARLLGMREVPVLVARDLTPAQAKAYRLTDNRLGEEADWDKDLLSLEVAELRDLGIDVGLTGFDANELNRMRLSAEPETGEKTRKISDGLTFQVLIDCRDEADQVALLERLKAEGRAARPLIL